MSWIESDSHMELWASENYVSPQEREWYRWINDVEVLLGHDADGDQERDGYSMDNFYDMWEAGYSVDAAVEMKGVIFGG